tara:strand:+ start:640 stop:753 length:114 start_codon:yes stop_codon:yes gene_type:complete
MKPIKPKSKVRFIPCDEFKQVYTWHKTNKNPKLNKKI